jgi:TusA-related sulfurtransferase
VEDSDARWPPAAHSVLEAGAAGTGVLLAAIRRRLEALAPGQVLEVVSRAAHAPLDVVAWCHVTGHELLELRAADGTTRVWIRKREEVQHERSGP